MYIYTQNNASTFEQVHLFVSYINRTYAPKLDHYSWKIIYI